MTTFVVMDKRTAEPGSEAEFIRDRFSVIAFIMPMIWLAWHRLWLEAFAALAAAIALAALGTVSGYESSAPLLSLLVSIFVAIEGSQLRVNALERRGYSYMATFEADNAADAELLYLSEPTGHPGLNADEAQEEVVVRRPALSAPAGPALGLLSYPGGR